MWGSGRLVRSGRVGEVLEYTVYDILYIHELFSTEKHSGFP